MVQTIKYRFYVTPHLQSYMSHVTTIIVFSYLCGDTVILGSTGSETFKRAMTINNKNYFVGVG